MLRFAVFADIHGKFLLPFKLVHYYQIMTGNSIDWILQCGDMGAFPSKKTMDKATLRHAKNDPDELGFMREFAQEKPEIRHFLEKLNIKMLCVRGNHEDHGFLDLLENQTKDAIFAIDSYQKVYVCRSGIPIYLTSNSQLLDRDIQSKAEYCTVVGVGRIGDKKGRNDPAFIQDYERGVINKLKKSKIDFDILITHDKPSESERGYGSSEIADLLDEVAFTYHFYGHTGEPYSCQTANNGITQSVKIAELEFNSEGKLSQGCMLIVEKQGENWRIEPIPLNQIISFMKNTWRYM